MINLAQLHLRESKYAGNTTIKQQEYQESNRSKHPLNWFNLRFSKHEIKLDHEMDSSGYHMIK